MSSKSPGQHPGIIAAEAGEIERSLGVGTYQRQRWLAVAFALERIEPWAAGQPDAEVARWFGLLEQSFRAGMTLVKQTRAAEVVTGEAFAVAAANIEGLWPLAKAEHARLGLGGKLATWPRDPGVTLAWLAGPGTAGVVGTFCGALASALVASSGTGRVHGERPEDSLPRTDRWYEGWRDRFAAEVEAKLLPRAEVWGSMLTINRDFGVALEKLEAEYEGWKARRVGVMPGAGEARGTFAPTADHDAVLEVLRSEGRTLTQTALVDRTRRGEKVVRRCMHELAAAGLVNQPHGSRKGWAAVAV